MKHPRLIQTVALAGTLAFSAAVLHAKDETDAKVGREEAARTALAKVPRGKIEAAELEKENGRTVWSFDISNPKSADITEVQVDAVSGKIVSVTIETPQHEAAEAAKEKSGRK